MFVKLNHGWLALAHVPLRGELRRILLPGHARKQAQGEADQASARGRAPRWARLKASSRGGFPTSKIWLGSIGAFCEPTLGEFAQKWLEEKTNLTESTRYDYNSILKFHIVPHAIASMRLSEIDDGDLSRFVGDMRAKTKPPKKNKRDDKEEPKPGAPLSARRINMVISRLRSIFATAYRRKLIADDPMRHVENLREPRHDADPFDLDETRRSSKPPKAGSARL